MVMKAMVVMIVVVVASLIIVMSTIMFMIIRTMSMLMINISMILQWQPPTTTIMCAAAFQRDRRIRVYDVDRGWQLIKDVHCRNLRWTVTDTCLSPNQTFLLFACITPTVHIVCCGYSDN